MAPAAERTPLTAVGRLRHDVGRVPALGWDVALSLGVLAMVASSHAYTKNDWHYYRDGARLLFGDDGLALYAKDPIFQIGPLGLAIARILDALPGSGLAAAITLTALLLVPVLTLVRRILAAARPDPVPTGLVVTGWLLVGVAWFSITAIAQLGDALALLGVLGAMLALLRGHPVAAGAVFALGVAAKPWSLAALPILLFTGRAARVAALATAAVVGAVTWLPFVVADSGTLDAGRLAYLVPGDAWQRAFGVGDLAPDWWRYAQILACWAVGVAVWVHARRGGDLVRGVVLAAALTALVRILSEVSTLPYYLSAALPLVLLADLLAFRAVRPRRPAWLPWATALAWLTLVNVGAALGGATGAVYRVACLAAAIAVSVAGATSRPARTSSGHTGS